MFEPAKHPLAPRHVFYRRFLRNIFFGLMIIGISLTLGMMGYHHLEGLSWIDSYLEAAMILSGMGPSATLHTTAGKLFAGTYALYSGLILIITIGVMLAPLIHRFFHRLHVETETPLARKPKT